MPSSESEFSISRAVASGKFHSMYGAFALETPARFGMLPLKFPVTLIRRVVPGPGRGSLNVRLVSPSSSAAVTFSTFVVPGVSDR